MSAVLETVGLEPSVASVADAGSARRTPGESKSLPSSPAQLKLVGVVSRDDRLRIWGHLSQEEKQQLRVLVDRARREREGIGRSSGPDVLVKCASVNSEGKPCNNWARNGEYCAVHARRMVA